MTTAAIPTLTDEQATAAWNLCQEMQPEMLSEQAECWTTLAECRHVWGFWAADYRAATTEADRAFALLALRMVTRTAASLA